VFASDNEKPISVLMALIPTILIFLLDAYYLGLEKEYRTLYNDFVGKLHSETVTLKDIFVLTPSIKEKAIITLLKYYFPSLFGLSTYSLS
jgi:hypothetical protein